MQNNTAVVKFSTNVLLRDKNTGEVFVNECNAVHPQNMARVIARGLANEANNNIHLVALGNGGTYVDTAEVLHYNAPNVTGTTATLYNETYAEVVDGTQTNSNTLVSSASTTDITSIVSINVIVSPNEPGDQWITDAQGNNETSNPETNGYKYEFDELGCFAKNPLYTVGGTEKEYLLLTHIVFHPIAKSQNRQLELSYTLTISVS